MVVGFANKPFKIITSRSVSTTPKLTRSHLVPEVGCGVTALLII